MVKKLVLLFESILLVCPIRSAANLDGEKEESVIDMNCEKVASEKPFFKAESNLQYSPVRLHFEKKNFTELTNNYLEFNITYSRRYSDVSIFLVFFIFQQTNLDETYRVISTEHDLIHGSVAPKEYKWTVKLYEDMMSRAHTQCMIYCTKEYVLQPRRDIEHNYCTFIVSEPAYKHLNFGGYRCVFYGVYVNDGIIKNYCEIIYFDGIPGIKVDNPYIYDIGSLLIYTSEQDENALTNLRATLTFDDPLDLYRRVDENPSDTKKCTISLEPIEVRKGVAYRHTLKRGYYLDRNYFSVNNVSQNEGLDIFVKDYLIFSRAHHEQYKKIKCELNFPKFGMCKYNLSLLFELNFADGDYLDYIKVVGSTGKRKREPKMEEVHI